MKKSIFVLIQTIVFSNLLYSQPQSYSYYSKLDIDSISNSEAKFLDEIEDDLYVYANDSKSIKYADINGVLNPMTHEEFKYINQNSLKSSKYQNYLIWNSRFDSAYFISFSRLYIDSSSKTSNAEYTRFITPLYYYKSFLDSNRYTNLQNIILQYLTHAYSIVQYDSNNISTAKINIDSTKLLSQAPINKFSELLYQATSDGDLSVFGDPTTKDILTRGQWNTINSSPITIKTGDQTISTRKLHAPLNILILTQWEVYNIQASLLIDYLQPAFKIQRNIISIGLEFDNQKSVYYKYEDIKTFCDKTNLSFEAFNQIFISLSLDKLAPQYK